MTRWGLVILLLTLVGMSEADWTDDFESYPPFGTLGSPWENTASMTIAYAKGYGSGNAIQGPTDGWTWGHAWRPLSGGADVICGRIFLDPSQTYQGAKLSVSPSKSATVDQVAIMLAEHADYGGYLVFVSDDYEGGSYAMDHRITLYGFSEGQWYDVRINLEDDAAYAYYKRSDSAEWTEVGGLKYWDDYASSYVGIHAERKGYLDDVACQTSDPLAPYLQSDLNQDGVVNGTDLCTTVDGWLESGAGGQDINGDGVVDLADFSLLTQQWAGCTDGSVACEAGLIHIDALGGWAVTDTCDPCAWRSEFSVRVLDRAGDPVGGAHVALQFEGVHQDNDDGITDVNGRAIVQSDCGVGHTSTTATLTEIQADGRAYDAVMNEAEMGRAYSAQAPGRPLLISFAQTTPDAKLLRQHVRYWEEYLPFDGLVIPVNKDQYAGRYGETAISSLDPQYWPLSWTAFGPQWANEADYAGAIADLQNTDFRKFQHNLIPLMIAPANWFAMDWYDDAHWATVEHNIGVLARIAYQGGCKGMMFDTEQYGANTFWDFEYLKAQYPQRPFQWGFWRNKVKQRGREFIETINAEFPGVHILMTFGNSTVHGQMCGGDGAAAYEAYHPPVGVNFSGIDYALLAPFVDGMLEGKDAATEIIDGYEASYFYKDQWEFTVAGDIVRDRCQAYSLDAALYTEAIRFGMGIYPTHGQAPGRVFFSPEQLGNSVARALGLTYWPARFDECDYDPDAPLRFPWLGVASLGPLDGAGYDGGRAVQGPAYNWEFGRAFRRLSAQDRVIEGRLYLDPQNTYQNARIGVISSPSAAGNGSFGGDDNVMVSLWGEVDGSSGNLLFWSEDYDGESYVDDDRVEVSGLSAGIWYDVQITLNDAVSQAGAAHRVSGTQDWTTLGVLDYAPGFAANYLGVSALRSGYVDDVGPIEGGHWTGDSCRYVWIWSEAQTFFIKGGPAGAPVVPDYAMVDESGNPAQLTEVGTAENALRARYYGVPQRVIGAIEDGKAAALD